jgi:hypothetical protein
VRAAQSPQGLGKFRNRGGGIIIDGEGGYFAGDASGGALYDRQGKKIKDLPDDGSSKKLETAHLANFIAAVRSRKSGDLVAEAQEGHYSTACCHLANISQRLGQPSAPEAIRESLKGNRDLADAFERCREYLSQNQVNLEKTPAVLGPWVTYDSKQERFIGEHAGPANALARREYRAPFVVPKIA